MATWKITPLCLGYITRPKKNFFEDYTGTEIEPFPVNAFYLTDGVHKVVIDNGGCSPEVEGMPRGVAGKPYSRTEDQVIDKALANIGVDINDIEAILFTHLHGDHAFNTHLFRKGIGASSHMNRNCRSGIVAGRKQKAIQKLFHGQGISRVDMCQGCTRLRDDRFWSYRYHIT